MSPITWLLTFAVMAALDVVWVLYIHAAGRLQPIRAAIWGSLIHGLSAANVLVFVHDPWYLTATVTGALIGTWAVVEWQRRRQ